MPTVNRLDRRSKKSRRISDSVAYEGPEKREGPDRRSGIDRRRCSRYLAEDSAYVEIKVIKTFWGEAS